MFKVLLGMVIGAAVMAASFHAGASAVEADIIVKPAPARAIERVA